MSQDNKIFVNVVSAHGDPHNLGIFTSQATPTTPATGGRRMAGSMTRNVAMVNFVPFLRRITLVVVWYRKPHAMVKKEFPYVCVVKKRIKFGF